MIAKIHSRQGFAGLVDYANDIKKQEFGNHRFRGCGLDIQQVHYGKLKPAGQEPPFFEKLRGTYFPEFFS